MFLDILSWNTEHFGDVSDPKLVSLIGGLPNILRQARASGTHKLYCQAFDRWAIWASHFEEISIFPASPAHIALYITHLANSVSNYASVNLVISALAWAHTVNGLVSPTRHPLVVEVLNGVKRMLAQPVSHKEPFTAANIREFFAVMDSSLLTDVRNTALIVTAFFAFLRISELLQLKRKNLTIHKTHVELFISQAKTDQLREGRTVFIARLDGTECPVRLLLLYASLAGFQLGKASESFIFTRCIFKNKKLGLHNPMVALTYNNVCDIVKNKASQINLNAKMYSTHSMRSGGATSAASSGVSERLLQMHGRWACLESKDRYVKEGVESRLSVSKNLL
jgi:integrase